MKNPLGGIKTSYEPSPQKFHYERPKFNSKCIRVPGNKTDLGDLNGIIIFHGPFLDIKPTC